MCAHTHTLRHAHTHTIMLRHAHTHTLRHAHTHTRSDMLTHTRSCSDMLTHTRSDMLTHTRSDMLAHGHMCSQPLTCSFCPERPRLTLLTPSWALRQQGRSVHSAAPLDTFRSRRCFADLRDRAAVGAEQRDEHQPRHAGHRAGVQGDAGAARLRRLQVGSCTHTHAFTGGDTRTPADTHRQTDRQTDTHTHTHTHTHTRMEKAPGCTDNFGAIKVHSDPK